MNQASSSLARAVRSRDWPTGRAAARFAGAPSLGVVHLPGPCGGIFLDSPPDVASHARAFTLLRAFALTPAATA